MDTSETWWERTARERWERESERSIEKEKPGGAALNTSEELKKKKSKKKKVPLQPPFFSSTILQMLSSTFLPALFSFFSHFSHPTSLWSTGAWRATQYGREMSAK